MNTYKKKYKEIVGLIKKAYLYAQTDSTKAVLEDIFPELKESEDDKIRKAIHIYLDWLDGRNKDYQPKGDYSIKDMIAWLEKQGEAMEINPTEFDTRLQTLIGKFDNLPKEELIGSLSFWLNVVQNDGTYKDEEKQGEQKPSDKVEPKFKVGDWITNGDYIWKIVEVKPLDYVLQSQDGNIVDDTISHVDEQFHSFTIEDAKDGDVLCCESGWTCIFKTLNSDNISFSSYCFMDNTGWFCETGSESHTLEKAFIKAYNGNIYPATKEQRDLLFQKMHEAGYEWDAEKKELKKIEQKSQRMISAEAKEAMYDKPAWSEEDELVVKDIEEAITNYWHGQSQEDLLDRLKSLKQRIGG